MNDEFKVYTPKWVWGLLIVFTILAWTLLCFLAVAPKPLVVNGTGIHWVDKVIGVLFCAPLVIGPIWGVVRFSSRMFISKATITVHKFGADRVKQYKIHDIIETKLRGEKYHKDTLRIIFSDGNKLTLEKSFVNFDKLKIYLRERNKLA